MFQQFNISRSGFGAYQKMMFNITNNIANANTPALFGFGFAKDGTLDVSILTSLQNEAADPSVFLLRYDRCVCYRHPYCPE